MDIFDALSEHADLPFERGRMLPAEAYTDTSVLAAEYGSLFADGWVCVGRTADVANIGDYITGEIPSADSASGGRSVIVIRGDDGSVAAFDNVCIHRGATLLAGCGNEQRFTCPYHAWTFRLDGSLIGAPYMNASVEPDGTTFSPSRHSLVPLALEVWEGFIFVSANLNAPPLSPCLVELTSVVEPFHMAGYVTVHRQVDVWHTNWKLMFENFMDAYHVFKVHRATFAKSGDNTLDTQMRAGTLDHAHHIVIHAAGGDIAHPDNTTLMGDERKTIVLGAVFPTHVMQLQPDWLWYLQISPLGVDRVRIRWELAVAPEMLAGQTDPTAYVADVLALVNAVNAEDHPIVEGVLRGVQRPQFPRGPLSYLERNVFDFDRYVATRLAAQR